MKHLFLLGVVIFTSVFAQAETNLTDKFCASLSNQQIAQSFLDFISLGIFENRAITSACLNEAKNKVYMKSNLDSQDVYSRPLVLEAGDKVTLIGSPVELSDEIGPMNIFEVNYSIQKAGLSKQVTGKLTFTRVFKQHSINDVGCAFLQMAPTRTFVSRSCVK